jgi:hypothetical protein
VGEAGGIVRYSIRKTAANGWGNAGFSASNILPAGSTILLSCTIGVLPTTFMLGQSTTNPDDQYTSINWAGYASTTAIQSYFQGAVSSTPSSYSHTWQVGDRFTMRQVGATVDYLVNDVSRVVGNVAHNSTDQIIDVAINSNGSILQDLTLFVDGVEQQIDITALRGCEFV